MREWQALSPVVGSPTRGLFLPQDSRVLQSLQALAREGALEFQEPRTGLALQSSSFVGSLSVAGIQIVIEPKLRGMQLMRLLRYAYGFRDLKLLDSSPTGLEADLFRIC